MKFCAPFVIAALAILVCCKPAGESESASDTLLVAEDMLAVASDVQESSSTTFINADFMFLGGAPFVTQQPEVFEDASGNPETHYVVQIPENASL